jgi:hypothetical protein
MNQGDRAKSLIFIMSADLGSKTISTSLIAWKLQVSKYQNASKAVIKSLRMISQADCKNRAVNPSSPGTFVWWEHVYDLEHLILCKTIDQPG